MSMNFEDFRVNYSQSHFGVKYAWFKQFLSLQGVADDAVVPCTYPNAHEGNIFSVKTAIPEGVTPNGTPAFKTKSVMVKWDPLFADPSNPNVFLEHPPLGLIQGDATCAYLIRKAVRQRNRGYCGRYTSSWVPNPEIVRQVTGGDASAYTNSARALWSIYNPGYTDIQVALSKLQQGACFGFALARLLGISVEDGRRYPLISYRDDIVGLVDGDGSLIINEEFASTSCLDYIYKVTGLQAKVR